MEAGHQEIAVSTEVGIAGHDDLPIGLDGNGARFMHRPGDVEGREASRVGNEGGMSPGGREERDENGGSRQ
jgi:hypothetical protein